MTVHAKITSKNQMTVPAELRSDLGLNPGDRLELERLPDGGWRLTKAPGIDALFGLVNLGRHVPDAELDGWIAEMRARPAD